MRDFSVGFTSGIGFGRDGEIISYRRANRPGTSSIKLDAKGGQRFADSLELERLFFDLSVDFEHTFSRQWTVALTPAFKARRYDNYFGEVRRDYRPSVELKAEWTPEWLKKSIPDATFEFSIAFERNYSNVIDKRYKLYEFGPAIVLSSAF